MSPKTVLLLLELPQGVTVFPLDPTPPTKALPAVDRFQTVLAEGIQVTNIGFSHLATITSSEYPD